MNEEIMGYLSSSITPEQNRRVLVYFEELKSSDLGWKLCLQHITSRTYNNYEHAQFFCLQIVEYYIKNKYNVDQQETQENIRQFIRIWPTIQSVSDSPFIKNKVAQIVALVFMMDYPQRWIGFFNDMLQTLSSGEQAVDFYLRVLKAIDNEIADRDIIRTSTEIQKANAIKDAIRESSIVNLVNSWYQILNSFENKPELVGLCHQVIGAYILWIDINLIANERFVPLLGKALSLPFVQETAADCIYDIINKGMEPMSKVKLVESFASFLSTVGIWQCIETAETDVDFLAKLGRVLNGMGVNLLDAYNKLFKAGGSKSSESTITIIEAVESKMPLVLQFLKNEDDDVSASVFDLVRDYLHFLKAKTVLTEMEMYLLTDFVKVLCVKLRYDSEFSFDHQGENEVAFKEFRKQLKILFENLISVDKNLVVDQMKNVITQAFRNWEQLPFEDVEAAFYLLLIMGEAVPPNFSQFSSDADNYSTIQKLLLCMIESKVNQHMHSEVSLQYFEVAVRYEKFFVHHSECIMQVLTTFLKTSGLFHPHKTVRSRSSYLFSRFIKSMRAYVTAELTQEILKAIQPLLEISDASDPSIAEPVLSDDDQLYVYEAVGVVIIAGETEQKRSAYMCQVINPLLDTYRKLVNELPRQLPLVRKQSISRVLCQIIAVVARLSKAFSPQDTMKSCGCVQIFIEALQTFLAAIDVTDGDIRLELTSSIRQLFHRLVVCLESEILPLVPAVSEALLRDGGTKSVQEYIPLINQIISKYKCSWLFQKDVTPFLKQIFPPLVAVVFEAVKKPLEENDETGYRDRLYLQRQYFQLVSCVVANNLIEVLPSQDPSFLNKIMESVIQGSLNFADPVGQKTCFSILKKFIELWAGPNGPEGFIEYTYKHVLPACFLGPGQPNFDLNDAQSMLVINETAQCLKCLLEKRGDEFLLYLRMHYLPSINMGPTDVDNYIAALQGSLKQFKSYLKTMFLKTKGT